jgi:hypothetical protein
MSHYRVSYFKNRSDGHQFKCLNSSLIFPTWQTLKKPPKPLLASSRICTGCTA